MAWSPEREHTRADRKDDVPFPVRGVPGGWRDWFDADDCAAAKAEQVDERRHRERMLVARAATGRRERGTPDNRNVSGFPAGGRSLDSLSQ